MSGESRQSLRIFIVEDHADSLKYMLLFLKQLGHSVGGAASLAEALQSIKAGEWDLLLSDIALGDGTGWELMKCLGENRPPIAVAVSAYDSPEDVRKSRAAGFCDTFSKPLYPEKLEALIERVCDKVCQ